MLDSEEELRMLLQQADQNLSSIRSNPVSGAFKRNRDDSSYRTELSFELNYGGVESSAMKPPKVFNSIDAGSLRAMYEDPNNDPRKEIERLLERTSLTSRAISKGEAWDDSNSSLDTDEESVRSEWKPTDQEDFTCIKFGSDYVLRGKLGRYLCANIIESASDDTVTGINSSRLPPSATFSLGAEGQGIGEALDCLNFVNVDKREDNGPVQYGMTVSIKAPAAKERLLGLREGTKLGFWRNLVGQGEKWQILKGLPSGRGVEEPSSRGSYARIGDTILLQTFKSDQLLSLYEGVHGIELRLVQKDRTGLGSELWQLEQFGSLPIPSWFNRPYLSGKFLVIPPAQRLPSLEVDVRAFPGSSGWEFPTPPPLNTLPLHVQHSLLVREVILVLSGVEGVYIRVAATPFNSNNKHNQDSLMDEKKSIGSRTRLGKKSIPSALKVSDVNLIIDVDGADRASANQVMALLPICHSAIRIREFIKQHSRYEYGYVSHALCSAIKVMIREFDVLVAQLEHLHVSNVLSLQKLTYLLQPSQSTLRVLEKLCLRLKDCIGGKLIDALYTVMLEQGDSKSRDLHWHLLSEASHPFLKTLSVWIFRGELLDPYKEFMIYEDTSVSKEALEEDFNAQYWDSRYTLREEHIPGIFSHFAFKALTAGKYLNVVRGCMGTGLLNNNHRNMFKSPFMSSSKDNQHPNGANVIDNIKLLDEKELFLSLEQAGSSDDVIGRAIEEAYQFSSRALLTLLENGHGLSSHLKSLSRFFLLEHGDFFIQFMDTAEEDLRKEVKDVTLSRIQSLLQLAVQTSTLANDPHKEDLTCLLASHNLIQHLHLIQSAGESGVSESYSGLLSQGLKGVEALTLDYKVGWPLSIVLSRRAITKYQLLSRLLYFSKHVERRVLSSWMDHQNTKDINVRNHLSLSYILRHRMLHFLQNFVYYMTLEVIGPRQHDMQRDMANARDMDEVMDLHERFLDVCLKECLLASQDLLKILTKIMTTCLLFADQMKKFSLSDYSNSHESASSTSFKNDMKSNRSSSNSIGRAPSLDDAHEMRQRRLMEHAMHVEQETSHEPFQRMLSKFSDSFDSQLKEFLSKLWMDSNRHHAQLSNLCVRLDYNGFYSSQFS
eukprot:gene6038-8313_t